MPDSTPPFEPNRPRSLLTQRDRKFLLDELDVAPQSQRERDIRGDIRDRVWNGLLDFVLISRFLEERDAEQIFHPQSSVNEGNLMLALQEIIVTIYRYCGDGESSRRTAFTGLVESAIGVVDTFVPQGENRVLTLTQPTVSLTVDYPRTVNLDELEATFDDQPDDLHEWDWERFSFDELLVLFWVVNPTTSGSSLPLFDRLLLDELHRRLADRWHFSAPWTGPGDISLDVDHPGHEHGDE